MDHSKTVFVLGRYKERGVWHEETTGAGGSSFWAAHSSPPLFFGISAINQEAEVVFVVHVTLSQAVERLRAPADVLGGLH
jgi:hypothetical protein